MIQFGLYSIHFLPEEFIILIDILYHRLQAILVPGLSYDPYLICIFYLHGNTPIIYDFQPLIRIICRFVLGTEQATHTYKAS